MKITFAGLGLLPAMVAMAFATNAIAAIEPFCIARDAWTCKGAVAIELLEKLDRKEPIGDFQKQNRWGSIPGTIASETETRDQLVRGDDCTHHDWIPNQDGKPGPFLLWNKVTVMYVDSEFAYFCQRYSGGQPGHPPVEPKVTFGCAYALIKDIRDLSWHSVSRERLAKSAATTTMNDVAEMDFCPADYSKDRSVISPAR